MFIYGLNPVLEALERGACSGCGWEHASTVGSTGDRAARSWTCRWSGSSGARRAARGGVHQGVVADVEPPRDYRVEELVAAAAPGPPLLVVLDGIEDPQNVGAILRIGDAAGAHGVVRQARHAASLDGAAAKASAGAVPHVRIATVVNIARALEELKEAGVWTVGLAGDAAERYDAVDLTLPTAIVLGAEGRAAAAGARALRPAGLDPDARGGRQPECVGRGGSGAVRGGPPAGGVERHWPESRLRNFADVSRPTLPARLAPRGTAVLQILFCLGWRSSVR